MYDFASLGPHSEISAVAERSPASLLVLWRTLQPRRAAPTQVNNKVDMTFSEYDRAFQTEVREWLVRTGRDIRERQQRDVNSRLSREDHDHMAKALAAKGWAAPTGPRTRWRGIHPNPKLHLGP